MRVDILTVLPGIFQGPLGEGVIRIAREKGLLEVRVVNLRDFTRDRHRTTDDVPYGGGPGMVMKPEPVVEAVEHLARDSAPRVILLDPAGEVFTQEKAWELSGEKHLIFICGRYEGVDERIRQLVVTEEISIGDYVLSGGEIPALVVLDAVVRLIPGVLHAAESLKEESFSRGLLEAPHFTRPSVFRGLEVPPVLRSGHHALIARWRRKESLRRTWRRRPELLQSALLSPEDRRLLEEIWQEEASLFPDEDQVL